MMSVSNVHYLVVGTNERTFYPSARGDAGAPRSGGFGRRNDYAKGAARGSLQLKGYTKHANQPLPEQQVHPNTIDNPTTALTESHAEFGSEWQLLLDPVQMFHHCPMFCFEG